MSSGTLFVVELVDAVARLCCMNLLLHGIGESDVGPMPSSGAKDAASGDAAYNLPIQFIFWLKDDALEEPANLPAPEIIAQEITDDLEAAL